MSKRVFLTIFLLIVVGIMIGIFIKANKIKENAVNDQTTSFSDSWSIEENSPDKAYLHSVDTEGFGLAKRIYINNKFMHTINANLPDLEAGMYYDGWLSKTESLDNPDEIVETGRLTKMDNDLFLFFQSEKDYTSFNNVIVTVRAEGDNTSGKIVLEGYFGK